MIGQRTDDRGQRRDSQFSILSSQFILSLAIFLFVFLFYFQTRSFEFLRFDDQDYTFLCPFVKDGLSWSNVKAAFTSFRHAAIWMPLTYISYMLDISLFGPGMGAHHLVNAAIHAANSVLLYWLLMGIFRGINSLFFRPKIVIALSSLIWALHPMRVEPVAWIAGRKELLCAFFVLLGLLAVVRRIENGKLRIENCKGDSDDGCRVSDGKTKDKGQRTQDKGQRANSIFSILHSPFSILLCCLAACMSKPTGMCFPFLAFCVVWMAGGYAGATGQDGGRAWRRTIGIHYSLLLVLVAFATGLTAVYSQTHAEGYDVRTLFTAPFSVRVLNAFKSLGLYLFKSVFPFNLHIDCRWPTPNLPADGWGTILAAVVGLAMLLWWVVASGRARSPSAPPSRIENCRTEDKGQRTKDSRTEDKRQKANSQFSIFNSQFAILLFFLFAIAPTLGVFGSFGREARADRFMYIPAMALSMLLAAALRIDKQFSILLPLVIIYAASTLTLIPTFRNDYTAFSRVLACDPVHPRALSHVASEECARLKDFDSGIRHFRDSLACEWNRDTACQLAFALATRGRSADISDIRALGESTGIARNPESDRKALMAEALGMAALKERRWRDAVKFFSAAVRAPARLYPPHDALARLGVALANGGDVKEAEAVFSALARPGAARESVRAFAERALEQIAGSQGGRIMLFY